jgi:hypothetical protein
MAVNPRSNMTMTVIVMLLAVAGAVFLFHRLDTHTHSAMANGGTSAGPDGMVNGVNAPR